MAKKVEMYNREQLVEISLGRFNDDEVLRALQRKLSNFGVTLMWNKDRKHLTISGDMESIGNLLAFCPEAEKVAQIIIKEE